MNIKANMRVDFDSIKNTSTVATGWVEIEFKNPFYFYRMGRNRRDF